MGMRPLQWQGETRYKCSSPTNIHLWVIKDCDGCEYSQKFAAGSASKANIRDKTQSEWYCRDCRRRRKRQQEQAQKGLGTWSGGDA